MNTIFLFLLFLAVLSQNAYAKKKSFFSKLERGVNITSKAVESVRTLDEIANNTEKDETRISYKDQVVYKDVEEYSDEYLEMKNKLAISERSLAWEKAKDGKHEEALILYEKSLENNANNSSAWHGYGWSFSELKRYDEARNAFLIAINLGAKDESWRYLGWNYARQGHHKEAVRCYVEAIKINPENNKAFSALTESKSFLDRKEMEGEKTNSSQLTYYRVNANPHLIVRSKPSVKGKKVGELPNNSLVKLIKFTEKEENIGGNSSHWALIEYDHKEGYVFGSFLEEY